MKRETKEAVAVMEFAVAKMAAIRAKLKLDTLTVRPEGGWTIEEYANAFTCSVNVAARHLAKCTEAGEVSKVPVRMVGKNGACRVMYVYVPK